MSRLETWIVGRSEDCDVVLSDSTVSRRHAEVVRLPDGRLHITDCVSTNGTYVQSRSGRHPIRQQTLEPDDLVCFGEYIMTARELSARCVARRRAAPERHESPRWREPELDPDRAKMRDPETGEVMDR